jgi:hypothetical protein
MMPITINGTTGIAGVDGSASTPAVQGSDTNTGVFYPAADTVGVSTGGSERMRIDSSGSLLVGGTSKASVEKLNITHDGNANEGMIIINTYTTAGTNTAVGFRRPSATTVGTITTTTSSTAYNTSSDYRLKHDVQPMTSGLTTVASLKPVTYKWKIDDSIGEGFIAHELAEHIPLAVVGEKDAVNEDGSINAQGVDYSKIVVHLVAAIQELSAKVDAQATEIAALKANAPA